MTRVNKEQDQFLRLNKSTLIGLKQTFFFSNMQFHTFLLQAHRKPLPLVLIIILQPLQKKTEQGHIHSSPCTFLKCLIYSKAFLSLYARLQRVPSGQKSGFRLHRVT